MNKGVFIFFITIYMIGCVDYNEDLDDAGQDELYSYYYSKERDVVYSIKNVPSKGSKEWIANAVVFIGNVNAFPIGKYKDMYFFDFATFSHFKKTWQRENLSIQYIPIIEGKTIFKARVLEDFDKRSPRIFYGRIGADGDVLMRGWRQSEYKESSLTIHKIDSLNKKIHYSFDLYFEYESDEDRKQREKGSEFPTYYWSKNVNFLGGHGVVDFPK